MRADCALPRNAERRTRKAAARDIFNCSGPLRLQYIAALQFEAILLGYSFAERPLPDRSF
jgi:hypothetical protein